MLTTNGQQNGFGSLTQRFQEKKNGIDVRFYVFVLTLGEGKCGSWSL